jgi:hypothetical protein
MRSERMQAASEREVADVSDARSKRPSRRNDRGTNISCQRVKPAPVCPTLRGSPVLFNAVTGPSDVG